LSVLPSSADVTAFQNTAVVKTSNSINITGLIAHFDAGQLNPDGTYAGCVIPSTSSTGPKPVVNAVSWTVTSSPVVPLIAAIVIAWRALF